MAFTPDILITSPDGPALVVEARLSLSNLDRTEEELKRYMVQMQCPVGLLVTPDSMFVYRDRYTARSPNSVERVGEFDVKSMWRRTPPLQTLDFEIFVQQWLELLPTQSIKELPAELRDVLVEHVLPAAGNGVVRAAHPRVA